MGKLKKIGIIALVIVLAALVISLNVYNYVVDSGYFARRTEALSTENYSFTSSQMSYYFYSQYSYMMQMYSYYGLDLSQYINQSASLKTQECVFSDGGSWFDYFMETAVEQASSVLTLCEAANRAGIKLEDEDYETIDETMAQLEETAKSAGMSVKNYIKNQFGQLVSVDDIKKAVELETLAEKYSQSKEDAADVSLSTLEKTYADSPDNYDTVDYITYTFDYNDILDAKADAESEDSDETSDEVEFDDDTKEAAKTTSKEYAEKFAAESTLDGFKKVLKDYFVNALLMTEEDADETIAKESFVMTEVGYDGEDVVIKWAFNDLPEVGEVKIFETVEDHEHTTEENGEEFANVYTVAQLTRERGRDESISSRDVRHILFSTDTYADDAKAKEVYDKWVEDGAKVEDFEALVKEYSEDPGSVDNGGLYEGVAEGDMVTEFNDWLFDEARVEGDHGIVKTTYGWHIMYYEGGVEGWKATITNEIKTLAREIAKQDAEEAYSVTVDNDALSEIPA